MDTWKEELIEELNAITETHVGEISSIMNRIGIEASTRPEWKKIIKDQILETYVIILDDAKGLQNKLIDSIEELLKRSQELCKQLRIKMPGYGSENLNLAEEKIRLKSRVSEYEALVKDRVRELNSLKKRRDDACKSLGIDPIVIPDSPLPTVEEIDKFSKQLEMLENERFKRETQFLEVKCKILNVIQELGIKPSLEIEKTVCSPDDSLFLVTDYNMKWLNEYYNSLVEQKMQTANEISRLREKVRSLWEKLDEDIKVSHDFMQKHTANSLATLEALKKEVKRCEQLKRANIEKFIKIMREELVSLWEKCHFSSSEREQFEYLYDNLYTEDLLTFHEIEVEKMKKYYKDNKDTILMLERREEYWKRKIELEEKESDPKRYKNRGGTLLKEEKERNGLTKKLRDMELELLEIATRYEETYSKPFMSWGRTIPDIIEGTREDYENNKKQHLSAKKQKRNLTPTPVKSGGLGSTFSGSRRNLLTLTPAPSTSGTSSCKRKLPMTQLFSSNKKKTPLNEIPAIKVNDKTIMQTMKAKTIQQKKRIRYSHEKKKRMNKIKRLSKLLTGIKKSNESTDYDAFEKSMSDKATCRSTLFSGHSSELAQPLPLTPKVQTPNKSRALTRIGTYTKLKTAPGSNMNI